VFRAWCFWKKNDDNSTQQSSVVIDIRPSHSPPSSLRFRSAGSENSCPWSNRVSSRPSSRSTRHFVRLQDDADDAHPLPPLPISGSDKQVRSVEIQLEPEMTALPEPVVTRSASASSGEPPTMVGLGRLDITRRRRWDELPRPKGPRKASTSSGRVPFVPGSSVVRPLPVVSRPSELVSLSVDSSRTLGSRTQDTTNAPS
jgi:hypothetical protein